MPGLDFGFDLLSDHFSDGVGLDPTISKDSFEEPDSVLTRDGRLRLASPLWGPAGVSGAWFATDMQSAGVAVVNRMPWLVEITSICLSFYINLRAASAVATVESRIAVFNANLLVLVLVDEFSLGAGWVSDGLPRLDLLDKLPEEAADGGARLDTGACHHQDQHWGYVLDISENVQCTLLQGVSKRRFTF